MNPISRATMNDIHRQSSLQERQSSVALSLCHHFRSAECQFLNEASILQEPSQIKHRRRFNYARNTKSCLVVVIASKNTSCESRGTFLLIIIRRTQTRRKVTGRTNHVDEEKAAHGSAHLRIDCHFLLLTLQVHSTTLMLVLCTVQGSVTRPGQSECKQGAKLTSTAICSQGHRTCHHILKAYPRKPLPGGAT